MALFKATIQTKTGVSEVELEAENIDKAKALARRKGKLMTIKKGSGGSIFESHLSPAERQLLLQNLANMLVARLGASEAIDVIKRSFGGNIKKVADKLLKHMESGADLVEALDRIGPPNFPQNILELIKAGSRSGETWRSLKEAVRFERDMENVKKNSRGGIGSGVAGFLAAAVVTLTTKFYVAPKLLDSAFFKMASDKVNLSFINVLTDIVGFSMLFISIIFVFLLLLGSVGKQLFPNSADKLISVIPFYKTLVLARNNYTTLYSLGLLIGSGVSMEQSLTVTANSAPRGMLKKDLERAVKAIKNGKPWANAMVSIGEHDKAALSVSADREQISNVLNEISETYREQYIIVVGSMGPTLQLVAAIFLVLSGGILFGYTMLPMLQVAAQGMGT